MTKAAGIAIIAMLAACGGGSSADTYSVGGTATGLASGSAVVLQLNGAATTTVSADGSLTVGPSLPDRVGYSVMVLTQPADQFCNLGSANGSFTGANVTDITLSCYATFEVLYSFSGGADGRNGAYPTVGLIQGADGAFYGSTQARPMTGQNATVFKVTSAGEMTVLYDFPAPTQDYYTASSLVQGTDGNFYGTTNSGGTAGYGTVFRIAPAGSETALYSFPSGFSGPVPLGALLQGADGNFYCIDPTAPSLYRIGLSG